MRLYSALAAGAAAADDDDGSLMGSNEKALFLFVFRFMTLTTPRAANVHYYWMSLLLFKLFMIILVPKGVSWYYVRLRE
jgi:hypothetical protein